MDELVLSTCPAAFPVAGAEQPEPPSNLVFHLEIVAYGPNLRVAPTPFPEHALRTICPNNAAADTLPVDCPAAGLWSEQVPGGGSALQAWHSQVFS